jgi:hypothetical protein
MCNGLPISNQQHIQKISQAKARAPGVLTKVVATVVCMACITVASASSMMSQAWVILVGGLVCTSVLSTLFTVWCILSQIALDCGFLLVEQTSLMLNISNKNLKILSNEFTSFAMQKSYRMKISSKPTLSELVTNMLGCLVINTNEFN